MKFLRLFLGLQTYDYSYRLTSCICLACLYCGSAE